jgi:hypothetical protein
VSKSVPVNITIKSQNNHVEFFERHFLNDLFNATKHHTPIELMTLVNLESNSSIGEINCSNCWTNSELFFTYANGTLLNRERIYKPNNYLLKISSTNRDLHRVNLKVLEKPDFSLDSEEKYHYFNNSNSILKLKIKIAQFNKQTRIFLIHTTKNGLNCDEKRFRKHFKLRTNGEILITRNITKPMICYVNIEMKQYDRLNVQIRQIELILLAGDSKEHLVNIINSKEANTEELLHPKQPLLIRDSIFGMNFNQFLIILILSFVCVLGALLLTSFILLRKRELAKKKCDYNKIKSQSPTSKLSVSSDHHLTSNSSTPTTQLWFQQTNKDFDTLDLISKNEKTETQTIQEVGSINSLKKKSIFKAT